MSTIKTPGWVAAPAGQAVEKKCTQCWNGLCQKHPRQDHGVSLQFMTQDERKKILGKVFEDRIGAALKKKRSEVERTTDKDEEEFMREAETWRREAMKDAGKLARSVDAAKVMGLKPVSDSEDSDDAHERKKKSSSKKKSSKKKHHRSRSRDRKHRRSASSSSDSSSSSSDDSSSKKKRKRSKSKKDRHEKSDRRSRSRSPRR